MADMRGKRLQRLLLFLLLNNAVPQCIINTPLPVTASRPFIFVEFCAKVRGTHVPVTSSMLKGFNCFVDLTRQREKR